MKEKNVSTVSGFLVLAIISACILLSIFSFLQMESFMPNGLIAACVLSLFILILSIGFTVINPNEAIICTLLGEYKGTVKQSGFVWVNPFYNKTRISLRTRNLETDKIKVNDKLGNPIIIGSVVVWKVEDTVKAKFEVDNYEQFVKLQCDSAVRHLAGNYAYDHFDDAEKEITLRAGGDIINEELEKQLRERLAAAGVTVLEARITHLVYAEEIAHAMLQRQQATAMIAARTKIVDGAVGMVDMALKKLSLENIVELDEERKAAMVSNLLVILCSDRSANPVVNVGSIY